MIDVALRFLVAEVNAYLLARTGSSFGEAELSRPVDDNGRWAVREDHLGVALVNIEEERVLKSQGRESTYVEGRQVVVEPDLKVNLHVLFAANFKQYDQALRHISHVLTLFQARPAFAPDRSPGLDPRIEQLTLELLSLSYEQLNQMWAFIGGKQLPSVVYRVRLISLHDAEPAAIQPPITTIATTVRGR